MIDQQGYRANTAIVLINAIGQVAWFKRYGNQSWQFPQGGLRENETAEQGMYRELAEETGLLSEHVSILGRTQDWRYYDLPEKLIKKDGVCIGQKQIWFLLQLEVDEAMINLEASQQPEFDAWRWVEKKQALEDIIYFKKAIYREALDELAPFWCTTA